MVLAYVNGKRDHPAWEGLVSLMESFHRGTQQLKRLAYRIRRKVLAQAASKGQGYAGQGLGAADIFAVANEGFMNWRLDELKMGKSRSFPSLDQALFDYHLCNHGGV